MEPDQSSRRRDRVFLLFLFLLFAVSLCGIGQTRAQAAAQKTISFKDGSGRSLQYNGKRWILTNRKGTRQSGLQYLKIKKQDGLSSGFYYFDSRGRLVQKKAVYKFNQTVNGVKFQGYYYSNAKGRFKNTEAGLIRLNNLSCSGHTFDGYYYVQAYGKLSADAQLRYIKKKVSGVKWDGYYWFTGMGKLSTKNGFRSLNQKVNGVRFQGTYFFGGTNGALLQEKGWISYKGKDYYLNARGKVLTDQWKDGYYLLSDGQKAVSRELPDGTYVDAEGKPCAASDYLEVSTLKTQITSILGSYSGTWSVYAKNLKTGQIVSINDCSFSPASTIKAFVMASTFDQIAKGGIADTSTIRSLLNSMITVSDNESYNALVRRHSSSNNFVSGAAVINSYLSENGYSKTSVHHTLHPSSSASTGDGSNTTSARDCGLLLERIYEGSCVSRDYSNQMLNLLLNQQRRTKIPAGVPSGIKVANKTGETSTLEHDIAIVYGEKTDYVLCVFSSNCSSAVSGIRKISSAVYEYWN